MHIRANEAHTKFSRKKRKKGDFEFGRMCTFFYQRMPLPHVFCGIEDESTIRMGIGVHTSQFNGFHCCAEYSAVTECVLYTDTEAFSIRFLLSFCLSLPVTHTVCCFMRFALRFVMMIRPSHAARQEPLISNRFWPFQRDIFPLNCEHSHVEFINAENNVRMYVGRRIIYHSPIALRQMELFVCSGALGVAVCERPYSYRVWVCVVR